MTNKDFIKSNGNSQSSLKRTFITNNDFFFKKYHIDEIRHALNIPNNSHLKLESAGGDQKTIYRVQQNILHLELHKNCFENKLIINNYFKIIIIIFYILKL